MKQFRLFQWQREEIAALLDRFKDEPDLPNRNDAAVQAIEKVVCDGLKKMEA